MKKINLRLYLKNGKTRIYRSSRATTRILRLISHAEFKKAYVRVVYGKAKCTKGCVCEFYNDGYYTNKDDLRKAIIYFWERVVKGTAKKTY